MHPAQRDNAGTVEDVSWQEIARLNARELRPLSRFADISPPGSLTDLELAGPLQSDLADRLLEQLIRTLGMRTRTPSQCTFLWNDGVSPRLPAGTGIGVRLREGSYTMLTGQACADADKFGVSPTMWWPDDQAWMVISQVDMDSSFVGCDHATILELLGNPDIEAWEVTRADPLLF